MLIRDKFESGLPYLCGAWLLVELTRVALRVLLAHVLDLTRQVAGIHLRLTIHQEHPD
mgnify:CR=1 FL=1